MPLFQIQDSDCPMFVVAEDYNAALAKWIDKMSKDNECQPYEVELPRGIAHVCDDDELIL